VPTLLDLDLQFSDYKGAWACRAATLLARAGEVIE
jgi:hypothetical protein